MNNVSMIVAMAALLTAGALPVMKTVSANNSRGTVASRHGDGANRDGLYLGRLDAQAGREARAALGRWGREADREMFRSGYEEGFSQATTAVR
ncbi:MAG TPA: hypothetical protein VF753_08545 [Terriglobales bacterium]